LSYTRILFLSLDNFFSQFRFGTFLARFY